jgi:hypothetical protein
MLRVAELRICLRNGLTAFAALEAILESNGWDEKQVLESSCELRSMQMFLTNYNRILCLHLFPSLTSLQIIGQNVEKMEGLDSCTALRSLWVVEACLSSIDGLQQLTDLSQLYLYGNSISRIDNLEHLVNLRTVWLAQNEIREIAGLSTLTCLRELNFARNPIECVPFELSCNTQLQVLNLSHTNILSCSAILHLASLPSLRELFLEDPNWGCAPVAKLANYQTMAIVRLPQLTVLDYLLISREASELAHSTFAKKRMFYNMRGKGCMQAMHNADAAARAGLLAQQKRWYHEIEACIKCRVRLQHEGKREAAATADSHGGEHGEANGSPAQSKYAQAKLAQLLAVEEAVAATCGCLKEVLEAASSAMHARIQTYLRLINLELESAGNIRVEESSSASECLWRMSCCELLQSRFAPVAAAAARAGLGRLRVRTAARVHNRPLRLRMDAAVDGEEYSTEYLFWAPNPFDTSHVESVVQHGTPPTTALGPCAAPCCLACSFQRPRVTCVATCELSRWRTCHTCGHIRACGHIRVVTLASGPPAATWRCARQRAAALQVCGA